MNYSDFLARKAIVHTPTGMEVPRDSLHFAMFEYQADIVRWALKLGKAAIFADCGMGKTLMQLEWARHASKQGQCLIIAPLAVAQQTVAEGEKFNIPVKYVRHQSEADGEHDYRIFITNYEMAHHFSPASFNAVVLDESSILKGKYSATKELLISQWRDTPYRLCCTATPAPNDFVELGNHSEFLGVMSNGDMLTNFFIHDSADCKATWRLKGHAQSEFWKWLASWAVLIRKPSDLGYSDAGFILPSLSIGQVTVDVEHDTPFLFAMEAQTLQERIKARRDSTDARVLACAELVNRTPGYWIVWCNLNDESAMLTKAIKGAVEVKGSDKPEVKEARLHGFARGEFRVLVSKPTIAGFGMNFQHCANMAFVGLSDSYEQFYQAVRRCWRFGQEHPVTAYVITATTEGAVAANIKRKEADAEQLASELVKHVSVYSDVHATTRIKTPYRAATRLNIPSWLAEESA